MSENLEMLYEAYIEIDGKFYECFHLHSGRSYFEGFLINLKSNFNVAVIHL